MIDLEGKAQEPRVEGVGGEVPGWGLVNGYLGAYE